MLRTARCCQKSKAIVTSKIRTRDKDGQEITEKLFGKQTIPGGQRGILIEALLHFLEKM